MKRLAATLLLVACGFCTSGVLAAEPHPIAQEVAAKLDSKETPFLLIVNLSVDGEDAPEKLIAAFKQPVVMTRKEPGNLGYVLSQDAGDPTKFMLHERWKSIDALDSHLKQPYLADLLTKLGDLLAGPPALSVHVPAAEPEHGGR